VAIAKAVRGSKAGLKLLALDENEISENGIDRMKVLLALWHQSSTMISVPSEAVCAVAIDRSVVQTPEPLRT